MTKIFPVSKSQCSSCQGGCCKSMPGCCTPEDVKRIFPGETLKESVTKALETGQFSIDWYEDDQPLYFIRPSTLTGAGKIYDPSWGGQCVFLSETGCKLGDNRPMNCKMLKPRTASNASCIINLKFNLKKVFGRLWRKHIDLSIFRDVEVTA